MRRVFGALLVLALAAGCDSGKAGGKKGAGAKEPEEKAVEAAIRDNADDPSSVEIASWGPHDLKNEVGVVPGYSFSPEKMNRHFAKVRVRYRAKNRKGALELYDAIFYVQDGKVFASHPNVFGDDWLDAVREAEKRTKGK